MNVDFSKAPAESQKIESNKDLIKKPCQECNITQASLWCQHCRLAYCLKCEKSIHCFKSFQHHKTMDYSVYIENNCKEKKGLFSNCNCGFNQELEMFCSTCQKFMCKVCSVSDLDQQRSCYSRNHAIKSTYDMWNAFQHNIGTGGSLEMNFAKEQFPIQKNMFMLKLGRVQSNRLAILVSLPARAAGRSAPRCAFSGGPKSLAPALGARHHCQQPRQPPHAAAR